MHSIDEVNQALKRGEYFWVDIARDGIALYELPGHALATPMPASPSAALQMAEAYFADWIAKTDSAIKLAAFALSQHERKDAAFLLHQATERAYCGFLLAATLYVSRSHNIKFLRSLAEDKEPRLIEAWPRESKIDRRRFELLKRAYVESRYSASYEVSHTDLKHAGRPPDPKNASAGISLDIFSRCSMLGVKEADSRDCQHDLSEIFGAQFCIRSSSSRTRTSPFRSGCDF